MGAKSSKKASKDANTNKGLYLNPKYAWGNNKAVSGAKEVKKSTRKK